MAIGNKISSLLGGRREHIIDFSRNMKISYTTAHALYHNKTKGITFDMLDRLCKYFEVGPDKIFPYYQKEGEE